MDGWWNCSSLVAYDARNLLTYWIMRYHATVQQQAMDPGEVNLQTMVDPAAFPTCKNKGAEDTTISSPEEANVRDLQNHCCCKYVV
eukprot:scaffold1862_cov268-Chaetoceros_neogracile.AAC.8